MASKLSRLNPLDYSIRESINNTIKYRKVQTKHYLQSEILRACKTIHLDLVRQMIDAFLRRVDSVESYNGQLIIDEHSSCL